METGLRGKVVLITGPTRNHGKATALAFAREGASLLICTRKSMDLLEQTTHEASACGVRVIASRCDATDEEQVNAFVQTGIVEFGHIDVVLNSAGWRARGDLLDVSREAWEAALQVNLYAPFLICRAVIPGMVQQRWGRILNYTGTSAYHGNCASGTFKLACVGFTRALARAYGKYNITANCVGPGSVELVRSPGQEVGQLRGWGGGLPVRPISRIGTVEDCADLVVFLASEKAGFITGQSYLVNGGRQML